MTTPAQLPADFVWGAATASYQIEGAVDRGRPRPQHLGHLRAHARRRSSDGTIGDVADDHYHRYAEDIALMAALGLQRLPLLDRLAAHPADRDRRGQPGRARLLPPASPRPATSTASPRRRRSTTGTSRRRSRTRAAGWSATPRTGSATTPRSPHDALGDVIQHWITLNEPWCSAFLGYGNGVHAPGRQVGTRRLQGRAPPAARPRARDAGHAREPAPELGRWASR